MRFGEGEKIWTSEERQQFEQGENIDNEKLPEIVSGWIEVVKNERKGKWLEAQKVQESLSGLYMGLLQQINQNPESALEEIKEIDYFYRRVFLEMEFRDSSHSWDFDAFKTGILGEYALAKCLIDIGHRVYLPTKEDNHILKVDLWDEDLSDQRYILGLQVKVGQWGKERKPQFVKPQFYTTDDFSQYSGERLKRLRRQAFDLRRETRIYSNVLPYFAFIPGSVFDSKTGAPTEAMSGEIRRILPSLRK